MHTCTACGSQGVHFVRSIESRRTGSMLPLYFCEACESFAMPSSHDQASNPERALEFHKRILKRNRRWSKDLFRLVRRLGLPRDVVVEVGCGSGVTLSVFQKHGSRVFGYDLNPLVVEYGREELGVELRSRPWDRDHPPADLLLCISVLEHISEPDDLLGELAAYCAEHATILAVSVPIHGVEDFRHVRDPHRQGSPFRAGDSHVMYYSAPGFSALLRRAGAVRVAMRPVVGWRMHFVAFEPIGEARLATVS